MADESEDEACKQGEASSENEEGEIEAKEEEKMKNMMLSLEITIHLQMEEEKEKGLFCKDAGNYRTCRRWSCCCRRNSCSVYSNSCLGCFWVRSIRRCCWIGGSGCAVFVLRWICRFWESICSVPECRGHWCHKYCNNWSHWWNNWTRGK
ncbi:uncharacterized protein [Montipora foliosa]|uniref:uncharacterized protein n=1 Tax=Montipora foliosa TaxID=591990 RepID=UPI0035F11E27